MAVTSDTGRDEGLVQSLQTLVEIRACGSHLRHWQGLGLAAVTSKTRRNEG